MNELKVNMKYCYGIKSLQHSFDFTRHNAHIIYAPNGSMKSSFAKVFQNLSKGDKPKDLIDPSKPTNCTITDENGNIINADSIFVIEPYMRNYDSAEKQQALLVNLKLGEEYNRIREQLDETRRGFLKNVTDYSGSPRKFIDYFTGAYNKKPSQFYECLALIKDRVRDSNLADYSDIQYEGVFSSEVIKLLQQPSVSQKLGEYIDKYNELVESSPYFKKGTFDHDNAAEVCSNLKSNGFFKAAHKIRLNSIDQEIADIETLETLFKTEKERILSDKELEKRFSALNKELSNKALKTFRQILLSHREIIPKLGNLEDLRIAFFASYFRKNLDGYNALLKQSEHAITRLREIEVLASAQKTEWELVVDTFKKRFDVPFDIRISNKADAGLSGELPVRTFIHRDAKTGAPPLKEEDIKENVLSTGERRALYLLNVIFEIQARKKQKETVLIIDDVADSFDYKNKYAIVQYLQDILKESCFKAIILTHNFDFFRTICNRLMPEEKWNNAYVINKTETQITLEKAVQYLDVFSNWKKHLNGTDQEKRERALLASIPFVRNLIQYAKGTEDDHFLKLTALLHRKFSPETASIQVGDLLDVYKQAWSAEVGNIQDRTQKVVDLLFSQAEKSMTGAEGVNLEEKIILSIAIRLKLEEFLIKEIADDAWVKTINKHQTAKLIGKYRAKGSPETLQIIDQVNLMTPENIHLNSFMYEPILDMSINHLQQLYSQVKALI